MKEDKNLVAFCGLYCGACKKFILKKCPGCKKNEKASWCKVRICCIDNNYMTCANCKEFKNAKDCKKFNNFFSKFFALVFRSDRNACIERIKKVGTEKYAKEMTEKNMQTIKK